ncbi:MAG: integral rane protein MviN [Hyphomicrobiales bacterium]|nr:integral rane protein MviN [Hyphomicrobiales bacterium]
MYKNLLSVAGMTLLSRVTGFLRDVVLGAILGAGALADAFYIAFRLPNHFRAIFGEGAFNAAFVPSYARVLETQDADHARRFSGQILTLLLISQLVLLGFAWGFTNELVGLLAPGLAERPEQFSVAVTMTRITFPYLTCVTLVTLLSGVMNAHGKFAAAAFAPVLLNLVMVAFLLVAFLFPNAGIAASFGIAAAGVLELALLIGAAKRARVLSPLERPRWTADTKQFFTALGPAVIGSAGVQIAMFADTIIGSLLPAGGVSSIYYADRIYQLPIGVIGIAAGTVLLPEMSRRLASGDQSGAFYAQNRTMALTIALSAPFFVAFTLIPDHIMRGVFVRGAFTEQAALAAANVLAAYGIGLFAIVLIRSAVASFQSRGDTRTPMLVSLAAVAFNVALKLVLFQPFGAAGLAAATAVGAWVNFGLLVFLARRAGAMKFDPLLGKVVLASAFAAVALACVAIFGRGQSAALASRFDGAAAIVDVALLGLAGLLVYGCALWALLRLFGVRATKLRPGKIGPQV